MLEFVLERGNYWAIIGLMMIGLYIAFAATNYIKRLVGLGTFQTSIVLFYVSLSRIDGGTAPILFGNDYKKGGHKEEHGHTPASETVPGAETEAIAEPTAYPVEAGLENIYSNPLPHVLMLTAIVVGVATLAVGLAISVRLREAYGTIEADEIREMDLDAAIAEAEIELDQASRAGAA